MTFDPKKYGATPVTNTQFNPSKYGATAFPKEAPPQVKKNFLQKVQGFGDFLGVSKFGQGLSTIGSDIPEQQVQQAAQNTENTTKLLEIYRKEKNPERKKTLANTLKALGTDVTSEDVNAGFGLSNKEVLGSAANVALNAATVSGLSNAGKLGSAATKINKIAAPLNSSKVTGRVGNTVLRSAQLGAASGIAQGLNEDEKLGDVAKRAGSSAAISGGLGFGIQGLAEIGKALTSKGVTTGIMNKTLKIPRKVIEKGRSPSANLVEEGVVGSKRGILKKSEKVISESKDQINKILKDSSFTDANHQPTAPIMDRIRNKLQETYQGALSADEIENVLDNLPIHSLRDNTAMNLEALNNLRSVIGSKYVSNNQWLNAASAQPEKITALKIAYGTLADIVKSQHPDLPELFARESDAITTKLALDADLAKAHIMTNFLELIGSGALGATMGGGSPQGIAQTAGIFAAMKALFSTPAQSGLAVGLDRLGKAATGPVSKAIRGVARVGTQRSIQSTKKKKNKKQ